MNINNITIEEFAQFVGSQVFTATFLRKDGLERTINARLGVSKGVKGTQPEATAKREATLKANNMVCVFEMTKGEYRTLNLNTLTGLKAGGEVFTR